VGLPLALMLALAGGVASAWYVGGRLGSTALYTWSTGIAVVCFMVIGVGILAMSQPDWRRVLVAMVTALILAAVVTVVFEQMAFAAGGGRFLRWLFNTALLSVV